jgi:hypothetical protein
MPKGKTNQTPLIPLKNLDTGCPPIAHWDCASMIMMALAISLPQNSLLTTPLQPPKLHSHHWWNTPIATSTATGDLHTLQTHTFFVSLPSHSRLTTDNSTATTRVTQPPPVQYSHHWWNIPIAASTAQPPVIYAQTHSLPIHSGHPSTLIMHGKSYCYQHNLCWHTTATAGNTANGARAMQPLPPEQHSHHW